ncbi:hypothetical protein BDW62DRAFT_189340 [Aspergillus aurantiobrunneus]
MQPAYPSSTFKEPCLLNIFSTPLPTDTDSPQNPTRTSHLAPTVNRQRNNDNNNNEPKSDSDKPSH